MSIINIIKYKKELTAYIKEWIYYEGLHILKFINFV